MPQAIVLTEQGKKILAVNSPAYKLEKGTEISIWENEKPKIEKGEVICIRCSDFGTDYDILYLGGNSFYFNPFSVPNILEKWLYPQKMVLGLIELPKRKNIWQFIEESQKEHRPLDFKVENMFFHVRKLNETEKQFIEVFQNERFFEHENNKFGNIAYMKSNGKYYYFGTVNESNKVIFLTKDIAVKINQKEIEDKEALIAKCIAQGGTVTISTKKGMAIVTVPNGSIRKVDSDEIITPKGNILMPQRWGGGANFGYTYGFTEKIDISTIDLNQYTVLANNGNSTTEIFGCRNGAADDFSNY